jgi:hypothetical protein
MSLNSTTRPAVPNWLPGAILGAALLIAGIGYTLISHVAPATPAARPVPTLHEYSNAAASSGTAATATTDFDTTAVPPPDRTVLARTAAHLCASTAYCTDAVAERASAGHWHGQPAWAASFRYTMQSGTQYTELDWVDPVSGGVLELKSFVPAS